MTSEWLSTDVAPSGRGSFWTHAEWADWSDRLACLLPEEYDGDAAQESLIERALTDLTAQRTALAEAAAWIAESIGYPIETKMPDHPMPDALWEALVDHVHADATGRWHGNELDRDYVESWLADEAGRPDNTPGQDADA